MARDLMQVFIQTRGFSRQEDIIAEVGPDSPNADVGMTLPPALQETQGSGMKDLALSLAHVMPSTSKVPCPGPSQFR